MPRTTFSLMCTCFAIGYLSTVEALPDVDDVNVESSSEKAGNESDRFGASAYAQASAVAIQRPQPRPLFGVECHVCTDCPEVTENTPSKLCPDTMDPGRSAKCVVYAEKYRHMHRPWYIRGCASERGSCADIQRAHEVDPKIVKLLFCEECYGDRCNVNGASTIAQCTIAFITMILMPVLSKFTLA